jgi:hypothetical protein
MVGVGYKRERIRKRTYRGVGTINTLYGVGES